MAKRSNPSIDKLSRAGGASAVWRAVQTGAVVTRHGARALRRGRGGRTWGGAGALALREAFEQLGPTYVKLAQLVASSPGLFPDVLAEEFRSCLDRVPPIPYSQVQRVIEEELGEPAHLVFPEFSATPLASASIGQVHEARLPDGHDVVVKVQRPGIRTRLEGDLRILVRIARILESTSARGRSANPVAVVEDFAANLSDELNFMVAARSMERFEANLRAFGDNSGVRTPVVHWRYTTPRLLTMERVRGRSLDDLSGLADPDVDLAACLKKGVRAWLESVLEHGFFHGDVHAGNLMIDDHGSIVLLDFGIVGRLDPLTRSSLRTALPALMLGGDHSAVAQAMTDLGAGASPDAIDAASREISELVRGQLGKPLAEMSYGQVLVDVVRIATRHRVKLPRELVLVAKQLLYFERYAKVMAPGWAILGDPEILAFLAQSLTAPTSAGPHGAPAL